MIAVIAVVPWKNPVNVYFGFLYVFPMLLVGRVFTYLQIALAAIFCTFLAELLDPFAFELFTALPQDILLFTALVGMGLFSREVTTNRERDVKTRERIEIEIAARREAEEQLEFLIQSSRVAILVMNANGEILTGISSAQRLFRIREGELAGRSISRYVPALGRVPSTDVAGQAFQTEMQCRGKRDNGDIFQASVFFSTYRTAMGPVVPLVVDASEDLRDRAEYGLEQLMAGSRILVGAVSHEVRNVCSAIAVINENLKRDADFGNNQDFEALGSLVEALKKIASLELRKSTGRFEAKRVDLAEVLDEARIVLEPYCAESDVTMNWNVPEKLPLVWTDRHSLLQVLLNLAKNSRRALEGASLKKIDVRVAVDHGIASITVCETGPVSLPPKNCFSPCRKARMPRGWGCSFHGPSCALSEATFDMIPSRRDAALLLSWL